MSELVTYHAVWWRDNPNVIEWRGVVDKTNPDMPVENADVEITLYDPDGNAVAGESWPLAMPHIEDGLYRGLPSVDVVVTDGAGYTAHIIARVLGVKAADIEVPVVVETRTE